jgi:MFS family permease
MDEAEYHRFLTEGTRTGKLATNRSVSWRCLGWTHALPETSRPEPAPQPTAALPGHHGLGLVLILVTAFMVVLDFSIVNVALPSIQHEFGFPSSTVQWVVTGYGITFGGLLILGGRAADLFGRRRMFIAGLVVFTAASLAGGLAQDPLLLVTSRVAQGVGAALVALAALSLITTGFAEGPARTRALGRYGATASIGFVSGLVLGGALVQFRAALLPAVAEVANGGEVAGAFGDRTAMLTGGLAAAVATGVAWRACGSSSAGSARTSLGGAL